MLKVEIKDEVINTRQSGAYTFYEQPAWIFFKDSQGRDNAYPEQVIIQHNKPKEGDPLPHKVGNYILDPRSFYRDRYSHLALGRIVLMPTQSNPSLKSA